MGFSHPAALSLLLLALPLAWLYLRPSRRPPATVSSLLLWRRIARPVVARRRRGLPPLFWVQAALLGAGATALAGPFVTKVVPPGAPRDAFVVLDASASMQTRSGGGTRFEVARDAAADRARAIAAEGRRVTAIAAGAQPRVLGTGLDGEQAARLFESLRAEDAAGHPAAAAELAAAQAGPEGTVDLFTDAAPADLVLSRDARAATSVHRFGEGGSNLALSSVRVDASPFDAAGSSRVIATVRSFEESPRTVDVELAPLDSSRGPTLRRRVVVAPRSSETASFDDLPWSGAFSARVVPGDDFALDDRALGWLPPKRTMRVVLVTDDGALETAFARLLRGVERTELRTVAPGDWRPDAAGDVTIFDGFAPALPPPGNVAYLAPRNGNPDVTVGPQPAEARLAEARDHDLLRGVQNPATLLSGHVVGLAPSSSLQPILTGRAEGRPVVLAAAGGADGRRVAATAFALRPRDLGDPDALPSLVFALNLVRWLSPTGDGAAVVRSSGERLRAGSAESPVVRLVSPEGEKRDVAPGEDPVLDRAGAWRAQTATKELPVLVSFSDPGESDVRRPVIGPDAPAVVPAARAANAAPPDPAGRTERLPRVRPALLALLGLMLGEWLVVASEVLRPKREDPTDGSAGPAVVPPAGGPAGAP